MIKQNKENMNEIIGITIFFLSLLSLPLSSVVSSSSRVIRVSVFLTTITRTSFLSPSPSSAVFSSSMAAFFLAKFLAFISPEAQNKIEQTVTTKGRRNCAVNNIPDMCLLLRW
jgi:hypothetical protein